MSEERWNTDSVDIVTILRKWAKVTVIPSGRFINEDLLRAAAELTRLQAELAKAAEAQKALAEIKNLTECSPPTLDNWEWIRQRAISEAKP